MPSQNLRLLQLLMLLMRMCWQQFVADLESEVCSLGLTFVRTLSNVFKILKLKFRRDFAAEVWSVFCC